MKFLALALALLLAVGSHAAAVQTNSPSPLRNLQDGLGSFLTQAKEVLHRSFSELDNTEYSEMWLKVNETIDKLNEKIMDATSQLLVSTDGVQSIVGSSLASFRETIAADIASLNTDLEPQRVKLMGILNDHITQYTTKLQPIVTDIEQRFDNEMAQVKIKFNPVLQELQTIVPRNIEETKNALIPIVDIVKAKVSQRLHEIREAFAPVVEEYKEHAKKLVDKAKTMNPEQLNALKNTIVPLVDQIKQNVQDIFLAIVNAMN